MKTAKLDFPAMASWMEVNGRRLDCNPYLSGAFEARVILEKMSAPKQPLHEVTKGGLQGIYHAGRESRQYVSDPAYGVPFLGSTDILAADLSSLALLSKKQVAANPAFTIQEGWTLITRSGTVGRMAYTRSDMAGMACSEHVMRVVPDPDRILPGYLYAYLSSRFGVPLIVSGTYGAIIQHIEPHHIADLPVPRLGREIEEKVDELIQQAAQKRCEASEQLKDAGKKLLQKWGFMPDFSIKKPKESPDTFMIYAKNLCGRFDAFFHSSPAKAADSALRHINLETPVMKLEDVTQEVFETTRFGRISVEKAHGVPFLSISDLGRIDPRSETFVSVKQVKSVRASVKAGWIILPRVGQLQGVFGRPTYITPHLDGIAVSDNNLRIVPKNQIDSGYLFAALSTSIGYWQIVRQASGTSIPYLDTNRLRNVHIPWCSDGNRQEISGMVTSAMMKRSEAVSLELEAISILEIAIKKGAESNL